MDQKKLFFFLKKNCLRPRDLINVIGTEILRSVPEIMDREFDKKWSKKDCSYSCYIYSLPAPFRHKILASPSSRVWFSVILGL